MQEILITEVDPGANKIWVESPTWYGWLVKEPKGWFVRLGKTKYNCHGSGVGTCYRYGTPIEYQSVSQTENHFYAYQEKVLQGYEELGQLTISLDGQQYAFPGYRNNAWVLHHNGHEIAMGDGLGKVSFSPDSKRLVYTLKAGKYSIPGESGQTGDSFYKLLSGDDIGCPVFSSDSRYWAFIGQKKRGDGLSLFFNQEIVTIPGEDAKNWECIAWCFSETGSRWAAVFAAKNKGRVHKQKDLILVVDGVIISKQSVWMDWQSLWSHAGPFSPDGSCLAYPIKEGNRFFVICDESKFGPYEKIGSNINWLPKKNKAVWAAKDKTGWRIYINGKPDTDRGFAQINDRNILFSADGNKYAYTAITLTKKECLMIKNGEILNRRVLLSSLWAQFSAKGKLAYLLTDIDNKIGVGVDADLLITGQDHVGRMYWSITGKRFGCECERNQKSFIYVDGASYGPFAQIEGFEFSDDEARWAASVNSDSQTLLLLDGSVVDRVDQLILDKKTNRLFANKGTTLQYYCVDNNKLYWRTEEIPGLGEKIEKQ